MTVKERHEGAPKPKKKAPNENLKKDRFWDHFEVDFGAHVGPKIYNPFRPRTETSKLRVPGNYYYRILYEYYFQHSLQGLIFCIPSLRLSMHVSGYGTDHGRRPQEDFVSAGGVAG